MPDRTENRAVFYNSDHSDSANEALRIYNELLSLKITSKMYMIDYYHINIVFCDR